MAPEALPLPDTQPAPENAADNRSSDSPSSAETANPLDESTRPPKPHRPVPTLLDLLCALWRRREACLTATVLLATAAWFLNPWGVWDRIHDVLTVLRPWLVETAPGKLLLSLLVLAGLRLGVKNGFALRRSNASAPVNARFEDAAVKTFSDLRPVRVPEDPKDVLPHAPVRIAAISASYMMGLHADLIEKLYDAIPLSREELDEHLLPVVFNLARFVHQVPASAYDHHAGVGGLFTHFLEVSLFCANVAKNTVFERFGMPSDVYEAKGRWVLAAAYAGLAHDIGKVVVDLQITASREDGSAALVWSPEHSMLLDWLRAHDFRTYTIDYGNRGTGCAYDRHKHASAHCLYRILPQKSRSFLTLPGLPDIAEAVSFAVEFTKAPEGGVLGRILHDCDAHSAARNRLETRGTGAASPRVFPLIDALGRLLSGANPTSTASEGAAPRWRVNHPDGEVFLTTAGCFIVWTKDTAAAVRCTAQSMGYNHIPEDPERIAAILGDNGYLRPNTDRTNEYGTYLWRVTPITQEKGYLTCVLFDRPDRILKNPLPVAIEAFVRGRPIEEAVVAAWKRRWKHAPRQLVDAEEEALLAATPEFQGLYGPVEEVLVPGDDTHPAATLPQKRRGFVTDAAGGVELVEETEADAYFSQVARTERAAGPAPEPTDHFDEPQGNEPADTLPEPAAGTRDAATSLPEDFEAPPPPDPVPAEPGEPVFLAQFNAHRAMGQKAAPPTPSVGENVPPDPDPTPSAPKRRRSEAAARLTGKRPTVSGPVRETKDVPTSGSGSTPGTATRSATPSLATDPEDKKEEMPPTSDNAARRQRRLREAYVELARELHEGGGDLLTGEVERRGDVITADATPFLERMNLSPVNAPKFFLRCGAKSWGEPMTVRLRGDSLIVSLRLSSVGDEAASAP